jgi:hypothetical protein
MGRTGNHDDLADLERLIEDIIVDAYGDDEQLSAFCQVFEDDVTFPADASVIGEPVSVVEIDYDGNERRGLTARFRREDGSQHVVAACDVAFPRGSEGARHVAAYRKWLGPEPHPADAAAAPRRKPREKATADTDPSVPVDIVVLSVKERTAQCRLVGDHRVITLRASGLWELVPGEIVTVRSRKRWSCGGHRYLSGRIDSTRLDVAALGLVPLRLEHFGRWDPGSAYWGEEGEPIEEWAERIIASGTRPQFEMEQVLPGTDSDEPSSDPIITSNDLRQAGKPLATRRILMELCRSDVRCLDAHAHLGNFEFHHRPETALRHYEVGLGIGELSLGDAFERVLPWGLIDNRPFLRCVHGYGLCLWRLNRFQEAERVFERMLWLNPTDDQGVRFLLPDVKAGNAWKQTSDE